ncbi:MAG: hypothetical protein JKY42_09560 [Flavobacteriales bacterium]|nr:hypothetical protein [Flavobacteriales bacterium]
MKKIAFFILFCTYGIITYSQVELDQSFPTSYDSLVIEGITKLQNYEFKKSAKLLKRAIEKDVINTAGSFFLGIAYNNRWRSNHRKQEISIQSCTKAIEFDYLNPKYFWRRGLCYQARGNHRLAIIDFDRAIILNPKIPEYYYYRATALLSLLTGNPDSISIANCAINDLTEFENLISQCDSSELLIVNDLIYWSHYHKSIAFKIIGDTTSADLYQKKHEAITKSFNYDYIISTEVFHSIIAKKANRETIVVVFPKGVHPFDLRINIRKKTVCDNSYTQ